MAKLCGDVYIITAPQVEFFEGLLELSEEWGGQLFFKMLGGEYLEPRVYDLDGIKVKRGHFSGSETGCEPHIIDFHTHPMYVQQAKSASNIRYRSPLPSAQDILTIYICHDAFVPHIIFTPIGNFVIEVQDSFKRLVALKVQQLGENGAKMFYENKFNDLQEMYMDNPSHMVAVENYVQDMARFGINVYYFPQHMDIRIEPKTKGVRDRCQGRENRRRYPKFSVPVQTTL